MLRVYPLLSFPRRESLKSLFKPAELLTYRQQRKSRMERDQPNLPSGYALQGQERPTSGKRAGDALVAFMREWEAS